MIILQIISFLFGGVLATWFFSWYYFKKGVSKNTNKLFSKFLKLIEVMYDTGISYSVPLNKDTFTKEEAKEIVENEVNEIIKRRNIQLKQFAEDILNED